MYFTSDSMLPENQQPLIITVAPYGPQWLPSDYPEDIPVTWEQQTQKAVDCYNAGATVLHFHVQGSEDRSRLEEFQRVQRADCARAKGRTEDDHPGRRLHLVRAARPGKEAHWLGYDTRHMLTELNPKPDQVTIVVGTVQMNILDLTTPDDVQGTQLANPAMQAAYQNMVADANPEFYIEHLKRLRKNAIQPMFAMAHVHTLEAIELLIRTGVYMGPLNHTMTAIGGAGGCGRNPYDFMEWVRRSPHGSVATYESLWRTVRAVCGDGGGARHPHPGRHRRQHVEPQGCAHDFRATGRAGGANREGAGTEGRNRGRSAPDPEDRHLVQQPRRDARQSGPAAQPQGWPTGLHREGDRRTTASAGQWIRWAPDSGAVCRQVARVRESTGRICRRVFHRSVTEDPAASP